jgi:hypothetical protein
MPDHDRGYLIEQPKSLCVRLFVRLDNDWQATVRLVCGQIEPLQRDDGRSADRERVIGIDYALRVDVTQGLWRLGVG